MEPGTVAPVTLINVLTVDPDNQRQLVDLLRENTESVIRTLPGWIATSLIASTDGKQVVIHSEWATPGDVEGMRTDPRMRAYFPKIAALATLSSTTGTVVMSHRR